MPNPGGDLHGGDQANRRIGEEGAYQEPDVLGTREDAERYPAYAEEPVSAGSLSCCIPSPTAGRWQGR